MSNIQTVFVPRHVRGNLFKIEGDERVPMINDRVLHDFHVGGTAYVGAIFTSTFGADNNWRTSNVMEIVDVSSVSEEQTEITFNTCNNVYVLMVHKDAIAYRTELEPLVRYTQDKIGSPSWTSEIKIMTTYFQDEWDKKYGSSDE